MKLLCPECRRENEAERIYCHECGARLDRSALAKEQAKVEDPKATQRRLRAMLDPKRAQMRRRFFQASKLLLGAFLTAAIVQMIRPPDLPARPEKSEMPQQINLDLEEAAQNSRAAPLRYTGEQVNAYLGYVLKRKPAMLGGYLQLDGATMQFDEGYCSVTVRRSLFGYPFFCGASVSASLENGTITVRPRGGSVGRMPVHPALMEYSGAMFADLRAGLARERKSIEKLGAIEFHPDLIVLAPKSATAPITPPPLPDAAVTPATTPQP